MNASGELRAALRAAEARVEELEHEDAGFYAVVVAARGLFPEGTRIWDSPRFSPLRDALAALAADQPVGDAQQGGEE